MYFKIIFKMKLNIYTNFNRIEIIFYKLIPYYISYIFPLYRFQSGNLFPKVDVTWYIHAFVVNLNSATNFQ